MTPQPVIVEPAASEQCSLFARPVSTQSVGSEVGSWLELLADIIIRAEADKLNFKTGQIGPRPEPSYVVYQTQSQV